MNLYQYSSLLKTHNSITRFFPQHIPYGLVRSFKTKSSYYYRSLLLMKFKTLNEIKKSPELKPRLVKHSSLKYINKRIELFARIVSNSIRPTEPNSFSNISYKFLIIPIYKNSLILRQKLDPYYLKKKFVYNSNFRRRFKILLILSLILFAMLQILSSYIKQIQKESFRVTLSQLLTNEKLVNEIAKSLIVLVKQQNIQNLTADGLSKLLNNESFKADTNRLVTNLVIEYLKSADCYFNLSKIIINDVYGSQKVIEEIFKLVTDLVSVRQIFDLENLLEDVLKKMLNSEGLIENIKQNLHNEAIASLGNEGMIRLTVNNLLGYFKD